MKLNEASGIIESRLISTGMSQTEARMLMAQFLEEEAMDYVECMEEVKGYLDISDIFGD